MLRLFSTLALLLAAVTEGATPLPCTETLAPILSAALPLPLFAEARSVAWAADGRLLIGGLAGIVRYDPATSNAASLVPGDAIPNGIPRVFGVDSDGKRLVAFNLDYSDVVADAQSGKIAAARRDMALQIAGMAIRGHTVAVLGFPVHLKSPEFAQLWVGEPGAPWSTFRPLHPISAAAAEIVRSAIAPYGGAIAFAEDGSIAIISPAEPGVFRYRVDGAPLPTLGSGLSELVVPRMAEATFGYRLDFEARYRAIFNKQPTIDDLIDTPDGLAIVVRRWSEGAVRWELWFPGAVSVRRRVRLGLTDVTVGGGHLHCSTKGSSMACVFDRVSRSKQRPVPELAIFDLKRTMRPAGCR